MQSPCATQAASERANEVAGIELDAGTDGAQVKGRVLHHCSHRDSQPSEHVLCLVFWVGAATRLCRMVITVVLSRPQMV